MDRAAEKQLVEKSKKDPEAFAKLFEEYYPKILRYNFHRTGNAEAARDITSEVFFRALKNLWQFRWTGAPFSAWLYKIASNEVNQYFRKKKYEPVSLEQAIEENNMPEPASQADLEKEIAEAQAAIDNNRNYIAIKDALFELPQKYQETLALRFLEQKKITEICEILGKKEGTVKSLISRGVEMLRKKVEAGCVQPSEGTCIIKDRTTTCSK